MKHYWNIEVVVRFPCQDLRSLAEELLLDVTMSKCGKVIYKSHNRFQNNLYFTQYVVIVCNTYELASSSL